MKRREIRKLKRAVIDRNDVDAMHALLLRSVRLGHTRLALLRCIQAEQMGLHVAPETIEYCREVAATMSRMELESLIRRCRASVWASHLDGVLQGPLIPSVISPAA